MNSFLSKGVPSSKLKGAASLCQRPQSAKSLVTKIYSSKGALHLRCPRGIESFSSLRRASKPAGLEPAYRVILLMIPNWNVHMECPSGTQTVSDTQCLRSFKAFPWVVEVWKNNKQTNKNSLSGTSRGTECCKSIHILPRNIIHRASSWDFLGFISHICEPRCDIFKVRAIVTKASDLSTSRTSGVHGRLLKQEYTVTCVMIW